jgi:DNA-binding response OmpR family regulator
VSCKAGVRTPRVLIVEDDGGVARMLRMCLTAAGYEVQQASGGREALDTIEKEPLDALVLDLGLPDQLGGAVLDRLRRSCGRATPAWVVISALSREEATHRYGPVGDFVAKPFDPYALIGKLNCLLGRK